MLATLGVLSALFLGSAPDAFAVAKKPSRLHLSGHVHATQTAFQRATSLVVKVAAFRTPAARARCTSG
jgi:predicted MPP superfamily phosphohydrolase